MRNTIPKVGERFKKIIFFWIPVIVWASVIFTFSANPTTQTSEIHWQDFVVKKTAHMIFYAILAILLYRALKESNLQKEKAGWLSIFSCFFYGLTDEFHQSFTPGREPRLRDVIFDTIGSALAIYFIWKWLPKAPAKLKSWAKKLQLL